MGNDKTMLDATAIGKCRCNGRVRAENVCEWKVTIARVIGSCSRTAALTPYLYIPRCTGYQLWISRRTVNQIYRHVEGETEMKNHP